MQKTRILFVLSSFYPSQIGGPSTSVFNLAKSLVEHNFDVFVITTDNGLKRNKSITRNSIINIEGINVYYSKPSIISKVFRPLSRFSVVPQNIFSLTKKYNPDFIHVSSFFDPTALLAIFCAKILKINYIISPRGELAKHAIDQNNFKKTFFINLPFFRRLFLKSYKIHVTSKEEKGWVLDSFTTLDLNKINVIPNIFRFNILNDILDETISLEIMEILKIKKYYLSIGRISPEKNIENIIISFSNFKKFNNEKLVIAGDTNSKPEYTNYLRELINSLGLNNDIVFTNKRVTGNFKNQLYKNCEALLFVPKPENFGMVVVEALSNRCIVICGKGTPWESLPEYNCGFYIDPSVDSLTKTLNYFSSLNDSVKEEMKMNTQKLLKNYESNYLINYYKELYQ